MLPGVPAMQEVQPQVNIAAPLNDAQLLCLMAAQIYGSGGITQLEAVDAALNIAVEAVARTPEFGARVAARRKEHVGGNGESH